MKIVCIGGGHGLSQVLLAIRPLCSNLTAIVATTDNGGSTGKIRNSHNCLAMGDIRRCCLELTDRQSLIHSIFEHRFDGGELDGHSLGNLTLLGLMQLTETPTEAVAWFNAMLGNAETVLPMSDEEVDLIAVLESGERVTGECEIDSMALLPKQVTLSKTIEPSPGSVEAIMEADLVLIGPGSIISSVMPPLLVPGLAQALKETTACRIFIENIAQEDSVVRNIQRNAHIAWLEEQLNYQFCDLSLSPSAIDEISAHCEEFRNLNSHKHNVSQLSYVFSELLKVPITNNSKRDDQPFTKVRA